jgi:hypothetical protein
VQNGCKTKSPRFPTVGTVRDVKLIPILADVLAAVVARDQQASAARKAPKVSTTLSASPKSAAEPKAATRTRKGPAKLGAIIDPTQTS